MKVIIFKHKDSRVIYRMETLDRYLEKWTMDEIEAKVKTYKCDNFTAELHDVAETDEEIFKYFAADSVLLFADSIIHPASEYVPKNTILYVLYKHYKHDTPTVEMARVFSDNVQLPTVHGRTGMLPIAWCRARDLISLLGLSKRDINKLTSEAKTMAWPWYKEDEE